MTRNTFRFITGLVALLAIGVFGIPALAQTTGSIEGTVLDSTGVALPGAVVEVKSPSMQGVRTTVSDSSGRFRLSGVPPGAYTVTASLTGFKKVQRSATVSLDATAVVLFKLDMSVTQEVVVTGETPVVDTTSTTAGTNYTAQTINKLPLGRNYADVVRLQPGVQVDNGETQGRSLALSIYGSTSAENLWLIDGVNTTNVIKGFQGKAINQEFIEEVEVKTGGYQAEYGRNTGGVVNVITKQGGNEFHGNAFGYWDNASSRAVIHNEQTAPYSQTGDVALTSTLPQNTRLEGGASLGGFFIKDRIWFFGAYDYVSLDQMIQPQSGPVVGQNFPRSNTSTLWSGKLTFKITDSTDLQGSVFADPQTIDGALLTPQSTNPNSYSGIRSLGGTDWSGRVTQLTGDWGLLLLQYGQHKDKYMTDVNDIQRVTDATANIISGVPSTVYGGYGSVFGPTINNQSTRDRFNGSMSFFFGGHQIKLGGDTQKDVTTGSTYYSGMSSMVIYPCIQGRTNYNCDLTQAPTIPTVSGVRPVYYRHDYYTANGTDLTPISSPFETPSKAWSIYVQDDWKVLPNLSVNFGVRYDEQKVYKGDNTIAMDLKDQWAPRLGFSWDFLNDGSSKAYGSVGRFYYNTPTDLNVRVFTANTQVRTYNYSATSLTQAASGAPRNRLIQVGTVEGEPVDVGIKQAYQDEFTIGIEKAIDSTFSLGAKFTYRTLGRTIEDRCDLDPDDPASLGSSCSIMNPGGKGPGASGQVSTCNASSNPTDPQFGECGLPGVAIPDAKRIYRGYELTARKRIGDSVWIQASYLYSTLKGNYSGAIRTGSGQTDPGINADYDYWQFTTNSYGMLELDHPHSFRVSGTYTTPFGLQSGLAFYVQSGAPLSILGYYNSFYPDLLYNTTRGTAGRTPTQWEADFNLAYNWKVGPVVVTPMIFVYNLFNNQIATSYNQSFNANASFVTNKKSPYYGQPGVEPGTGTCPAGGGPCSDNQDYLKITGRTQPRVLRAAIKIAF
jgi:outer membrane receptor protein involved in Fe transport